MYSRYKVLEIYFYYTYFNRSKTESLTTIQKYGMSVTNNSSWDARCVYKVSCLLVYWYTTGVFLSSRIDSSGSYARRTLTNDATQLNNILHAAVKCIASLYILKDINFVSNSHSKYVSNPKLYLNSCTVVACLIPNASGRPEVEIRQ